MDIVVLGVDLGKNSCSLAGLDAAGRVVLRRRERREGLERFVEGLPRCTVAMEACCGAHHLGRAFGAQGHDVRLMSPEYVRPYMKAQKNETCRSSNDQRNHSVLASGPIKGLNEPAVAGVR